MGSMTIKVQAYKALVRPTLEFSSPVCDPYLAKNINQLEAVQRRATNWVVNCHRQTSIVDASIQQLKWQPLKLCRLQAQLTTIFKHSRGLERKW